MRLFTLTLMLILSSGSYAFQDGFNELFISSHIAASSSEKLNLYFSHDDYKALREPSAPNFKEASWPTINHWVNQIARPNRGKVIQNRDNSQRVIRDIIFLAYLEPMPNDFAFDAEIVGILSTYKANNAKLILAFGMDKDKKTEPQWVKNLLKSAAPENLPFWRNDVYAGMIASFLERIYTRYGDDSWRIWLTNNVLIEPMNEYNAAIDGYPPYAAHFDRQVKDKLAAKRIPMTIIQSSIISGSPEKFRDWYTNTRGQGYYQQDYAVKTLVPNIHLYMADEDGGSFQNMILRFGRVVNNLTNVLPGSASNKVIIGEIGFARYGNWVRKREIPLTTEKDDYHNNFIVQPLKEDQGGYHDFFISNVIDNDTHIKMANVEYLAFWRLFGAFSRVSDTNTRISGYKNPHCLDPASRLQATFGFVRLATPQHWTCEETPQEIEPQVKTYYGL